MRNEPTNHHIALNRLLALCLRMLRVFRTLDSPASAPFQLASQPQVVRTQEAARSTR